MTARTIFALAFCLAVGCATGGDEPADDDGIPSEEDDLVLPDGGKSDTGYLSTLATELEGELQGELRLEADDEARQALGDADTRQRLVTEQIKFAKNQLNTAQLHLNLTAGELSDVDAREDGGKVVVTFRLRVETIVSFEELQKAGIADPAHLTGERYGVRVPADPRRLFTRAGEACAEGFDAGSLADYNYFYYFAPDKQGCAEAVDISDGVFTVRSLLPSASTFPEYDLLTEDRRVTAVALFGAADHDPEVSDWDWGMREWRDFTSMLRSRGFEERGVADETSGKGAHFVRTREGLEEVVDVVSPRDLKALNEDRDGLFGRMVRSHEIVLYLGHSFYGSLRVLDDPATYAPGVYQIFFMGSCWSYEYYTKQIFRNKVTAEDETGWALADVVNDTESGWFHNNEEFSRILLTNLFAGAETGGMDGDRRFHWQNIIDAMNQHALDAWRRHATETHEIMGVSGVRTNRYDPERDDPPPDDGEWQRHEVRIESDHPYADDLDRDFEVAAPEGATSMRIHFERLDTEPGFDFVDVRDSSGNVVANLDGAHNDFVTPEIPGSSATVTLATDYSITAWGFAIDFIEYRQ